MNESFVLDPASLRLAAQLLFQQFPIEMKLVRQELVRREHVEVVWLHGLRGEVLHVLREDGMRAGADCGRQHVAVFRVVGH